MISQTCHIVELVLQVHVCNVHPRQERELQYGGQSTHYCTRNRDPKPPVFCGCGSFVLNLRALKVCKYMACPCQMCLSLPPGRSPSPDGSIPAGRLFSDCHSQSLDKTSVPEPPGLATPPTLPGHHLPHGATISGFNMRLS